MKVLKELNEGKYERTMVTQQEKGKQLLTFSSPRCGAMQPLLTCCRIIRTALCRKSHPGAWKWSNYQRRQHHKVGLSFGCCMYVLIWVWFGFISCTSKMICRFDHTPLATPNGDVLIRDLTFEVKPRCNSIMNRTKWLWFMLHRVLICNCWRVLWSRWGLEPMFLYVDQTAVERALCSESSERWEASTANTLSAVVYEVYFYFGYTCTCF